MICHDCTLGYGVRIDGFPNGKRLESAAAAQLVHRLAQPRDVADDGRGELFFGDEPVEREDRGVIAPTAALSSIVYTPEESMDVMRYLYGPLHEKVWGPYGFYDAFSQTDDWYPQKYLAIDQGPIAVMIENHRSELLWRLFMSHPDVQNGLRKLGFESPVLQ